MTETADADEKPAPDYLHEPHQNDDEIEDWLMSLGRELVIAAHGSPAGATLEVYQQYEPLSGEVNQYLYLRTRQDWDNLEPAMLSFFGLLGERDYSVRESHNTGPMTNVGSHESLFRIEVPKGVENAFKRYAKARGGKHPAPPQTSPANQANYTKAEPLPHPALDPDGFEAKINEVKGE